MVIEKVVAGKICLVGDGVFDERGDVDEEFEVAILLSSGPLVAGGGVLSGAVVALQTPVSVATGAEGRGPLEGERDGNFKFGAARREPKR